MAEASAMEAKDEKSSQSPSDNASHHQDNINGNIRPSFTKNDPVANTQKEFMAEPELLALVIEIKLQAGSKKKGNESTSVDTMDLCHRRIQRLPAEMFEIIKDDIVRYVVENHLKSLQLTFLTFPAWPSAIMPSRRSQLPSWT